MVAPSMAFNQQSMQGKGHNIRVNTAINNTIKSTNNKRYSIVLDYNSYK